MIDDVRLEGGELQMDLTDVPMRFEGGTQNVAGVVGLHAALDYLSAIGLDNILEHEQKIYTKVWQGLEKIAGLRILGSRDLANRAGVLAFVVDGVSPFDLSKFLDLGYQIAIRSGHHCCSPLMSSLGVSATNRISFGLYNSEAEAERLIAGIEAVVDQFRG
jgi:cysteine desulfurase/selenocysteine lyase